MNDSFWVKNERTIYTVSLSKQDPNFFDIFLTRLQIRNGG
jgi:hypothetical protein